MGDARWVRWSIDTRPVMWGWMMWPQWETVSCGMIWICPIISRTPSNPIFRKVPSLTPTHLWFSAGAAVHFFPWVGHRSPLKKCP